MLGDLCRRCAMDSIASGVPSPSFALRCSSSWIHIIKKQSYIRGTTRCGNEIRRPPLAAVRSEHLATFPDADHRRTTRTAHVGYRWHRHWAWVLLAQNGPPASPRDHQHRACYAPSPSDQRRSGRRDDARERNQRADIPVSNSRRHGPPIANQAPHRHRQANSGTCRRRGTATCPPHLRGAAAGDEPAQDRPFRACTANLASMPDASSRRKPVDVEPLEAMMAVHVTWPNRTRRDQRHRQY